MTKQKTLLDTLGKLDGVSRRNLERVLNDVQFQGYVLRLIAESAAEFEAQQAQEKAMKERKSALYYLVKVLGFLAFLALIAHLL